MTLKKTFCSYTRQERVGFPELTHALAYMVIGILKLILIPVPTPLEMP